MEEQFSRTRILLGEDGVNALHRAKVVVFGIGGVGGYVVEALARSGVGRFVLVDSDTVEESNINRQIIATHSTLGRYKTEVMKERILDIYPEAQVEVRNCFYLPENADTFDFHDYNYVVDAVDTVTAKIDIILRAKEAGVPVISAMGAGNKLDGSGFLVADIYKTSICPLAKVMRRELKKRGVDALKVVYSEEIPQPRTDGGSGGNASGADGEKNAGIAQTREGQNASGEEGSSVQADGESGKRAPGSVAFVPSVAGLILAGEVVKDLVK